MPYGLRPMERKLLRRYLQSTIPTFKLKFHLEDGLSRHVIQRRYSELFFSAWSKSSSYKSFLLNEPVFNLFYNCCGFGEIFCIEVVHFVVANMEHKQLKKCSKYKLVVFLDEKQMFSFANFCTFFQVPSFTHSELIGNLHKYNKIF